MQQEPPLQYWVFWIAVLIGCVSIFFSHLPAPSKHVPIPTCECPEPEPGPDLHLQNLMRVQIETLKAILSEYLIERTKIKKDLSQEIIKSVFYYSLRQDVDPIIIVSLIVVESKANPKAFSSAGAMGLMQVLPSTAAYFSVKKKIIWEEPYDLTSIEDNVRLGTAYYKHLLFLFARQKKIALAAYNWGPNHIQDRIDRKAKLPQVYPGKVLKVEKEIKEKVYREYEDRFWKRLNQ